MIFMLLMIFMLFKLVGCSLSLISSAEKWRVWYSPPFPLQKVYSCVEFSLHVLIGWHLPP